MEHSLSNSECHFVLSSVVALLRVYRFGCIGLYYFPLDNLLLNAERFSIQREEAASGLPSYVASPSVFSVS